jgi:hypothetical protein
MSFNRVKPILLACTVVSLWAFISLFQNSFHYVPDGTSGHAVNLGSDVVIRLNVDTGNFIAYTANLEEYFTGVNPYSNRPAHFVVANLISHVLQPADAHFNALLPQGSTDRQRAILSHGLSPYIALVLLNILLLIASVVLCLDAFRQLFPSLAIMGLHGNALLVLMLAPVYVNNITKVYIFSPHSQMFLILYASVSFWLLVRITYHLKFGFSLFVILSLLTLTYQINYLIPVFILFWAIREKFTSTRSDDFNGAIYLSLACLSIPVLFGSLRNLVSGKGSPANENLRLEIFDSIDYNLRFTSNFFLNNSSLEGFLEHALFLFSSILNHVSVLSGIVLLMFSTALFFNMGFPGMPKLILMAFRSSKFKFLAFYVLILLFMNFGFFFLYGVDYSRLMFPASLFIYFLILTWYFLVVDKVFSVRDDVTNRVAKSLPTNIWLTGVLIFISAIVLISSSDFSWDY